MIDRLKLEPIIVRAVLAVAAVLISEGIQIDQGWIDLVVELVGIGFALWAVLDARKRVTPLVRPRDAEGHDLVAQDAA